MTKETIKIPEEIIKAEIIWQTTKYMHTTIECDKIPDAKETISECRDEEKCYIDTMKKMVYLEAAVQTVEFMRRYKRKCVKFIADEKNKLFYMGNEVNPQFLNR